MAKVKIKRMDRDSDEFRARPQPISATRKKEYVAVMTERAKKSIVEGESNHGKDENTFQSKQKTGKCKAQHQEFSVLTANTRTEHGTDYAWLTKRGRFSVNDVNQNTLAEIDHTKKRGITIMPYKRRLAAKKSDNTDLVKTV